MKDFNWEELKIWDVIIWRTGSKTYWWLELRVIVEIVNDNQAYIRKPNIKGMWKLAEVNERTTVKY